MGSLRIGSVLAIAAAVALGAAAVAGASAFRVAPQTTITSAPPAEIVVRGGGTATATWEFTADLPGSKFTCKFTGHQVEPCTSPMTYAGLAKGRYTFTVYAFIPHGARDTTRARSQVRVVKK